MLTKVDNMARSAGRKIKDNRGKIVFVATVAVIGTLSTRALIGQEKMFKNFLDQQGEGLFEKWTEYVVTTD